MLNVTEIKMKIKSTLVILLGLLALSSTGAHAALKGLKGLSTAEAVASTEDGAESIDSKKTFCILCGASCNN